MLYKTFSIFKKMFFKNRNKKLFKILLKKFFQNVFRRQKQEKKRRKKRNAIFSNKKNNKNSFHMPFESMTKFSWRKNFSKIRKDLFSSTQFSNKNHKWKREKIYGIFREIWLIKTSKSHWKNMHFEKISIVLI